MEAATFAEAEGPVPIMPRRLLSRSSLLPLASLFAVISFVLVPATASALTQTTSDPSDAPSGPQGTADLRSIRWDAGPDTTTLTVSVEESTYGAGQRAALGIHVLLDADADGIADDEILATRNEDGVGMDLQLRSLDAIESTGDCQDLAGKSVTGQEGVATTIAGGLESFAFTFDTDAVPDGLARFRWAAFGQSPEDLADAGPWDYAPDAANPDPDAANPGDRRCGAGKGGVRLDFAEGIDLQADACPGFDSDPRNQVVGTAGADTLVGSPAADVVCGLGGADLITGLGGSDILIGGPGGDTLTGGGGGDRIDGGAGDDVVRGGPGPDTTTGGSGVDTLDYTGSPAGVKVNLTGPVGAGGFISASGGHAAGDRHQEFERVTGSSFGDALTGNGSPNLLVGGKGDDTLAGKAADDDLRGQGGVDSFDGGPGTDRCDRTGEEDAAGCER